VAADTPADSELEGGLHAFDRSTGKELWKYPSGRGVLAQIIGLRKDLFALTTTAEFVCIDKESGKRRWSYPLKWSAWDCPAATENRVFVGSNDGTLYALNAQSGSVVWQANLEARISTSIQVSDRSVHAGTADGKMHRVDITNGELGHSLRLDENLRPAGLPIVRGDNLLVLLVDAGNEYRQIASVDLALSKVRWRRAAPDKWTTSRIFEAGNAIIFGQKSGEITAYSCVDGEPIWSAPLLGTIRSVGGADGILYIGTTEGNLYALRPPSASSKL
jgi:outer membrane protein assembly factor BamB